MTDDWDVYATCDRCGKPIRYGNASVSITREIEQVDRTEEHPDGGVTVMDATVLFTFCAECGNQVVIATEPHR